MLRRHQRTVSFGLPDQGPETQRSVWPSRRTRVRCLAHGAGVFVSVSSASCASARSDTSGSPAPHSRPCVSPPHVTTAATAQAPLRWTITGLPLSPAQACDFVAVVSSVHRCSAGLNSFGP